MICTDCNKGRIELPTILLYFAATLATSVSTNLIIYKTCYVTLGYNQTQCELLGKNYTDNATAILEKEVQPYAATLLMTQSILGAIFPPILCLLLGPWTDKYGRKPLFLFSISGSIVAFLIMTIICAIPNATPWLFLLTQIPTGLTGGTPALMTAMICYITDLTPERERGLRIGIFEGMVALGMITGTLCSSFILNAWGYVTLYIIGAICLSLGWLYIYFFLPESISVVETEGKFKNIFDHKLILETFQTVVKPREGYDRSLMLTLIAVITISIFTNSGDAAVIFLYLRQTFHWTLQQYTIYTSINSVTGIFGAIGGIIILYKLLKIREAVVTLLGFISQCIGFVLQGVASSAWVVYLAATSKCLGNATSPLTRSLLSKVIPTQESGKVFAVVTALETVFGLLGSSLYNFVYKQTLDTYPAAFSFVSVGFYVVDMFAVGIIVVIQRFQVKYATVIQDQEQEQEQEQEP